MPHHGRGLNRFLIYLRTLIAKTTILCYSVRPNISFLAGTFLMGSKVWAEGISINYQQQINFSSGEVSGNFVDYRLNSTAINSVYGASDTNQPEAVRVLSLVKAY